MWVGALIVVIKIFVLVMPSKVVVLFKVFRC
jgi:hypothetical protein